MTIFEDRLRHDLITYEPLKQIDLNIKKQLNRLNDYCNKLENNIQNEVSFEVEFTMFITTGLYKSYNLNCSLLFNNQYPFAGPKLKCYTKIYHPNIWDNHVCMSLLRDTWTPANNLSIILYSFYILMDINENDLLNSKSYKKQFTNNPLNTGIADYINKDTKGFIKHVKSNIPNILF